MRRLVCSVGILVLIASCGNGRSGSRDMTVLAASSLTGVFESLKSPFAVIHKKVKINYSFAGSSQLVTQAQQGIEADVIATTDEDNINKLVTDGSLDGEPTIFARNSLAIIVAPGNPEKITRLADLGRKGLKVVLAAPQVPVGKYARDMLSKEEVDVEPVSLEENVKAVVSKVSLGEADAGIVYVTDVKAAGAAVSGVDIPQAQNVIARYPIAVLKDAPNKNAAKDFVELVLSKDGKDALIAGGFRTP